jgi:hypothetical protein
MKRIFDAALASVLAFPVALTTTVVCAHDLRGIVAEQDSVAAEVWTKIDEIRTLRRFLASEAAKAKSHDFELESVVDTSATWPDRRVSVCFLDGGPDARIHVIQVAQRWMESTGLQLDFGAPDSPRICDEASPNNVRVSFAGPGYWSYVGREAKVVPAKSATLNLEGMDKAVFTEREDGTILHEFGHAIGFKHEHQSPVSVCETEFDWDYLYKRMGSWGWSRDKINHNMRQLQPSTKFSTSAFDPESVMLYSLNRNYFRSDLTTLACYIPKANNATSKTDREAAATAYPIAVSMQSPPTRRGFFAPRRNAAVTKAIKRLEELTDTR